jgi:hypothetical protein
VRSTVHQISRKRLSRCQLVCTYIGIYVWRWLKITNKWEAVCAGESQEFCRQLREKYFDYSPSYSDNLEKKFDYFVFKIVDYICVNCGLLCSGARHDALAQTIGNARGLDINSPRSAENHPQDLRFHRHQQRNNPNNARGLDDNFASDRDCDSTITTRLRHRRLRRATTPHPIKAKFSSSKSQFLPFRHTRHSGAPPWIIILHIIDFEKLWKP